MCVCVAGVCMCVCVCVCDGALPAASSCPVVSLLALYNEVKRETLQYVCMCVGGWMLLWTGALSYKNEVDSLPVVDSISDVVDK